MSDTDGELVVVGIVKGAWGLQGDLRVEPLTDNPERFAPGASLYMDGRPVRVRRSRPSRGGLIVKLESVGHRTAAERLRGKSLSAPSRTSLPLPEGHYYHYQLIDLEVYTHEGEPLGVVKEVLVTGANDVYVVARPGSKDVLIPALKNVVVAVDLAANRMTVHLPEGLR